MKYLFFLIAIATAFTYAAKAPEVIKQTPQGFDTVRTSVSHGKLIPLVINNNCCYYESGFNLKKTNVQKLIPIVVPWQAYPSMDL